MKKMIAILIALMTVAAFVSGCGSVVANEENTTAAPVANDDTALQVLEKIWEQYGEDEKFAVIGGNIENPVDNAPGQYDLAYAENLGTLMGIPNEELEMIHEAASVQHMMNNNIFTAAAVGMKEGVDGAAFAASVRSRLLETQWLCGAPEQLWIGQIGENLLIAYGGTDAMDLLVKHLGSAYPDAVRFYNEAMFT